MFWYDDGVADWQLVVMTIGMIAFWALMIGAVYTLVRRAPHADSDGRDGPRRILDRRLARGEINPEEYRRLRELLEQAERPSGEVRDQS